MLRGITQEQNANFVFTLFQTVTITHSRTECTGDHRAKQIQFIGILLFLFKKSFNFIIFSKVK